MFLITTDGRTDTGSGVAYFFNQHDAEQVCREHNSHEALLKVADAVWRRDLSPGKHGIPDYIVDLARKAIAATEGRST